MTSTLRLSLRTVAACRLAAKRARWAAAGKILVPGLGSGIIG
jgi:hypothetical protein